MSDIKAHAKRWRNLLRDKLRRTNIRHIGLLWLSVAALMIASWSVGTKWRPSSDESGLHADQLPFLVTTRLAPAATFLVTLFWLKLSESPTHWSWGVVRLALLWAGTMIAQPFIVALVYALDPCPVMICMGEKWVNRHEANWLWMPFMLSLHVFTALWVRRRWRTLW